MEKEICVLKNFRNILDATTDTDCTDLDNAIKTIEYAMKPKTCDGCKQSWKPNNQTFHKYFCEYLQIPVHGDFCCNKHEPKDNA